MGPEGSAGSAQQQNFSDAFKTLQMDMGYCRLNQPYSPQLLEERVFQDGPASALALIARVVQLSTEIVSFAVKLYFDRVSGVEDNQDLVKQRATELRDMLTRLGPTFIKAGQVRLRRCRGVGWMRGGRRVDEGLSSDSPTPA